VVTIICRLILPVVVYNIVLFSILCPVSLALGLGYSKLSLVVGLGSNPPRQPHSSSNISQ